LWQKIEDDFILIDHNIAAEKITKGMIKNYVGVKASELYENQPGILKNLYRCAIHHKNIFTEKMYTFRSTGEEKFLSVRYSFIPSDLVIVHIEDITGRKKTLEGLLKSDKELKVLIEKLKHSIDITAELYRTIFENTGTATVIIEEDTTISIVNKQFEELSGYSREEIEWKKSWTEFVVKEDLQRMIKFHTSRRIDVESSLKNYEFCFINKEGNIRNILITIDMIPGTKRSVASLLDITESKKTELELKKSTENYKAAYNRAEFYKDIFTHDINNILQIISSGIEVSELILEKPEKFEEFKKNDIIIREQVIRATKLVDNVRKLSQLEDTNQDLEKIEILNILENVISSVRGSYKDRKITYQIKSLDRTIFIKGNDFLKDVFENLLINAIQHNVNEIIEITVRISRDQQNGIDYLKMEFIDNGNGVDDNMKEIIFKRGYNKDKSALGMGLGLSLVQQIIEIYEGKIWVEDRVNGDRSKGSNFIVLIPEGD